MDLLLYLSERLKTFFMISEEHWENDKISFQNMFGACKLKDTRDAHYILCLLHFVLWATTHEERKRSVIVPEKLWSSTYW